ASTDRRQRELVDGPRRAGESVAVDNTTPRRSDRAPLLRLGRERGARLVGYYFPTTPKACLERNRTREGKAKVPAVAVFKSAKIMEPPSLDEGWDALYAVTLEPPGDFTVTPWTGAAAGEGSRPPRGSASGRPRQRSPGGSPPGGCSPSPSSGSWPCVA